jgi:hypothetical protein
MPLKGEVSNHPNSAGPGIILVRRQSHATVSKQSVQGAIPRRRETGESHHVIAVQQGAHGYADTRCAFVTVVPVFRLSEAGTTVLFCPQFHR